MPTPEVLRDFAVAICAFDRRLLAVRKTPSTDCGKDDAFGER